MQSACTCSSSASELSASEMSMITDPSDESASGEFGRESSRLALLLTCTECLKKSMILNVDNTILPNIRHVQS